jgi:hypothetical protein
MTVSNVTPLHSGPMQRLMDALRNLDHARREYDVPGRIRDAADASSRKARALTEGAVSTVRRRPAPFVIGAIGLVAIGVGAALLANPRTRAAGSKLAKRAWSAYQDRKPF